MQFAIAAAFLASWQTASTSGLADPELLPPLLKGFKAVPPFVTDLNLSLDDRYLYVSCWGTGELQQYDVSDPFSPKLTSSVKIGGMVRRGSHPSKPDTALNGGPQMVEISRDGRRVAPGPDCDGLADVRDGDGLHRDGDATGAAG